MNSTVTAGVLTGKSELIITTVAGLRDILYDAEFRDRDGGTWRRLGGDLVAQDGVRGAFHLGNLGDATMVMLCAPFSVAVDAVQSYYKFIVQHATGGRHQVVPVDPAFNMKPVEGGADLESFEEAAALRDRLNAEAANLDAPPATDAPEWLHVAKHDGSYIAAADVSPGDFMFEYYETGSVWLPVLDVAVADGTAAITYGLGSGATVSPPADRTVCVLRKADAIALHARRRGLVAAVAS